MDSPDSSDPFDLTSDPLKGQQWLLELSRMRLRRAQRLHGEMLNAVRAIRNTTTSGDRLAERGRHTR